VGFYSQLSSYNSTIPVRIVGSGNMVANVASVGATAYGAYFGGVSVAGLEIEAPRNSAVALHLEQNAVVNGVWISLSNGTAVDHLIELGASATTWAINGITYYFSSDKGAVSVSGGNMMRADASYFGGNVSGKSHSGEGSYTSNDGGQKLQSFTLTISNVGGILKHQISEPNGGSTNFASAISGETAAQTTTPTGPDGSTAMVGGGKIGSASANVFWFDTANQRIVDTIGEAVVVDNNTGTPLMIKAAETALAINGKIRNRLNFTFKRQDGTVFNLDTVNIPRGDFIEVTWLGHLSPQ
jgi:hypothetical protein